LAKGWGVEIEGAKFVRNTMKDLMPREARNIARRAVVAVARQVRDTARENAPRDSGTLKKAIRSRRSKGGRDKANAEVNVTTGTEARRDGWYWHFIEFGTTKMKAQPFIQPTLAEWRNKAAAAFETEWWGNFRKEMVKRAKKQRGAR